ncbi:MAG TPA: F0F1 ATP synthase subunit alpha, partial [Planctomycetota bacterium]|nr:F0F1 ATP synthase subunit alpha [Planctomycetota bacterium]
VAFVGGLEGVGSQEVLRFAGDVRGIAFNLLKDAVGCLLLGPEEAIEEGSAAARTGRLLEVPVGEALVGRVVDALGQPLDGRGSVGAEKLRPVERPAPGVVQRRPVCESLHTGMKAIDALVPLGRGQRELVLGDRKIGKTTLAVDAILSQRGAGVTCVYAAIGQKASTVARVVSLLEERGALAYTAVVVAFASDPPAFRYIVPYTACAIAEDVMAQGRHALVVYDDLSKHAVTYREISALLKRPIGREAYPGDIFYVHSRLLERAARMRDDLGGGSLTAIPVVETQAGDLSAYIPTNVISICDGQIFLDTALFNEGFKPGMDVGLSVSRVGGMAQSPAMRKVAGRLRIDLAQYHEMARFVKFGAEVDPATLAQLRRGEREVELLKQDAHAPLPLEKEIVTLYAAVNGHTDAIPLDRVRGFEAELHAFMERRHPDILAAIRDTRDLTADVEARLEAALAELAGRGGA